MKKIEIRRQWVREALRHPKLFYIESIHDSYVLKRHTIDSYGYSIIFRTATELVRKGVAVRVLLSMTPNELASLAEEQKEKVSFNN